MKTWLLVGIIFACVTRPLPPEPGADPKPMFTDVTKTAGVDHLHVKPVFDERLARVMPWISAINAGVAAADFNNDGRIDLYVLNSRAGAPNALYRNNGNMTFTDVAAECGVADVNGPQGVSMDAVFGDIDNDGDEDLFIACYGKNKLFLNEGGRFTDITEKAGVGAWCNASCAVFLDYNNDGWIDILIGNYFSRSVNLWNIPSTKILPDNFVKARNGGGLLLYRNNGDNSFTDVTAKAGLSSNGWTLDIGMGDFDNDGDQDLYVANDYGEDSVYRNNGDGTFTNITRQATGGDFDAGMNVDVGDFDNDGYLDIYVTNIMNRVIRQGNMLWQNQGDLSFVNVAQETHTWDGGWGWGAKFVDFDNDGDLDLYTVNGYISAGPTDLFAAGKSSEFFSSLSTLDISDANTWPDMRGFSISGYEKDRLFRNDQGAFQEIASQAGVAHPGDGRGIALADFDADGDVDLFITNCGQTAVLYRNDIGNQKRWLQVQLIGTRSNRDAIGARISVTAGGLRQIREIDGGNGFSSESSRVAHFGLAAADKVDHLEIRWPSGVRQAFNQIKTNQKLTITEPVSDGKATHRTGRGPEGSAAPVDGGSGQARR